MTEAEKLRDEFDAYFKNSPGTYFDALAFFVLSPRAIMWCRANSEVVEALANGTWVAVPKQPTQPMWVAMGTAVIGTRGLHHDAVSERIYTVALAAAPKKPEE